MDTQLIPQTAAELAQTTAELVQEWLAHEAAEGRSPRTREAYRRGLQVFLDWHQAQGAPEVDAQLVGRFKQEQAQAQGYSVQTVNHRLSAVRSFFRFLVLTGRLASNPAAEVRGVKRVKSRTHKRDALTNGEVGAVLGTCDPGTLAGVRDRAILALMAFCGLRAIEIHRANLEHLGTRQDRLVLKVWGKGRAEADELAVIPREQEAPIRAWLRQRLAFADTSPAAPLFVSLSNRSRGARLSLRAIRAMVTGRYEEAGVIGGDKSTHSLRHSAITNAIRRGASPLQVQAMARHGSFDTTLGYYHEVSRLEAPAEDLIDYGG